MVIKSASDDGNNNNKYRILRSQAKILGLGNFTAWARYADFPVLT